METCTLISTTTRGGQTYQEYTCTGVKNYYDVEEPITWWDQVLSFFGL